MLGIKMSRCFKKHCIEFRVFVNQNWAALLLGPWLGMDIWIKVFAVSTFMSNHVSICIQCRVVSMLFNVDLLLENAWIPKTHTINLDQDPYIMLHLSRLYLNNHILMVAGRSTIVESSTFSLALQQFHFNKSILILIILTHIPHLLLLSPYSTSPQVHWSFQVFFSCFELVTPISSPCSCMLVFTYLNSHSFFM